MKLNESAPTTHVRHVVCCPTLHMHIVELKDLASTYRKNKGARLLPQFALAIRLIPSTQNKSAPRLRIATKGRAASPLCPLRLLTSAQCTVRPSSHSAVIAVPHFGDKISAVHHFRECGLRPTRNAIQVDRHGLITVACDQSEIPVVKIDGKYAEVVHLWKDPRTRGVGKSPALVIRLSDQIQSPLAVEQASVQGIVPPIARIQFM